MILFGENLQLEHGVTPGRKNPAGGAVFTVGD